MSTPTESMIANLHAEFCRITGQEGFPLRFNRQREWYDWCQYGFSLDDLKLVVRYLKKGINDGRRQYGCLKFSNLIAQPDKFDEDLAEARRIMGHRKPTPSTVLTEQRIGDIRRQVEVPAPDPTVCVSDIFKQIQQSLQK